MKAIRITRANIDKILHESPIDRVALQRMVKEYDTPSGPAGLFFVPQSDLAHDLNETSWMTIPYRLLNDSYNFDANKINSEFVEITPK